MGYGSFAELAGSKDIGTSSPTRPVVCVQGLGFVGTAMAVAVASARDARGEPVFDVVGIDLPSPAGIARIEDINRGVMPVDCADDKLITALRDSRASDNLFATADPSAFALAEVAVVDVPLDLRVENGEPHVDFGALQSAIRTLGKYLRAGSLVVVETTVPPGTTEKVVVPTLGQALSERGLQPEALHVAHSYERVMPGRNYLDSIINFWRVYAGHTPAAADACERFLSKVINVREFPLCRLASTVASETAKVLENSYRATNIAFMEEWGRFAESVGIDMFEIVDAIRMRPTHSNIRQPGWGVGGYCLPKDPYFGLYAARELFGRRDLEFPFSTRAATTNERMPLVSLEKVRAMLGGNLAGKRILLLGVSYLQDVGDTRYSPAEPFYRQAVKEGARVECHDPHVASWPETGARLAGSLPVPWEFDVVVFAIPHRDYLLLDLAKWLGGARPKIFDANNVLSGAQRARLRELGCEFGSIGRGAVR